jgi:hypothetical protein
MPLAPAEQLELGLAAQEVGPVVASGEQAVGRFFAQSWSRTVLSPSNVVKTSVSAFSAAKRFDRR